MYGHIVVYIQYNCDRRSHVTVELRELCPSVSPSHFWHQQSTFYSQSDISMMSVVDDSVQASLSSDVTTVLSHSYTQLWCHNSAAMPIYGHVHLAIRLCCLTSYMATNEACPAQIWAYCILMTSAISIYGHKDMGTNGACPNMGHIWPQMRHAQIWAYCILMTSAIFIYGQKKGHWALKGEVASCPQASY